MDVVPAEPGGEQSAEAAGRRDEIADGEGGRCRKTRQGTPEQSQRARAQIRRPRSQGPADNQSANCRNDD